MAGITNAADQYTRFMVELFDERDLISCSTGFQAFFGNPAGGGRTIFSPDVAIAEIDIIRGNERLAALVPRGTISRSIGTRQRDLTEGKFTNVARAFPLVEEDGDINANELLYRLPGEGPYNSNMTRRDRLRVKALKIHMESCRRVIRTFEYLASQSVLTGKMPAILGTTNPDLIYDFYRNTDHEVDVITPWDDTDADIIGDLTNACRLIRVNGKAKADFLGIGASAMNALLDNAKIKERADNRRFELIQVNPNNPVPPRYSRFVEAGWVAYGRLLLPPGYELWVFTYPDTYDDGSGDPVEYMPVNQAFVCKSNSRYDRYFGPPEVLPVTAQRIAFYLENFGFNLTAPMLPPNIKDPGGVILPAMFMPYAYGSLDFTTLTHRVQAAPIFTTTHTDAFVVLKGLIT